MNQEKQFKLNAGSKNYILATSEWFNCVNPQYFLIRSELCGGDNTTLFLLGVDGLAISAKYIGVPKEEIKNKLFESATNAIAEFLENNVFIEGSTYYGEFLSNETFEIFKEKPEWENGNWGQKYNFNL